MDTNNDIDVTNKGERKVPLLDTPTHNIFIELCLNEARLGNKPGSHINKVGYENLIKNMKERTGKSLSHKQIKNHWENMKKDWRRFDRLMRLESGIGWDPVNKSIVASSEWWDEKIKADKDLGKFRGKNLEMYQIYYEPLFRDFVAVGDKAIAPSDFQNLDDEDEEHLEGKGDSDDVDAHQDEEPLFPTSTSSNKRKKRDNNASKLSSKGKNSIVDEFSEKLDTLMQAISSRSSQTFPPQNSTPSTQECMDIVTCFPGFEEGSLMYNKTLALFLKKEVRQNFMVPTTHAGRIEFLKFLMHK